LSFIPPSQNFNMPFLPPKCFKVGSIPQLFLPLFSFLDSHLNLSRNLGVHQCTHLYLPSSQSNISSTKGCRYKTQLDEFSWLKNNSPILYFYLCFSIIRHLMGNNSNGFWHTDVLDSNNHIIFKYGPFNNFVTTQPTYCSCFSLAPWDWVHM
jgi:hypothetical protein